MSFTRSLAALALPIALQNLITASVLTVDVVLLGHVSQNSLAAINLAGQVGFVFSLFLFGLSTGVSILTAQACGREDWATVSAVRTLGTQMAGLIATVFVVASFLVPEVVMSWLTSEPRLQSEGALFLRFSALSLLFQSYSQLYLSSIRSQKKAGTATAISAAGLATTLVLDASIVLVVFPNDPQRAVAAVGVATVVARLVEALLCGAHELRGRRASRALGDQVDRIDLRRQYVHYTLPVLANYLVWGGALAAAAAVIGRLDADLVAANALTSAVKNLAVVFCLGLGSGGAILVGTYLGEGRLDLAQTAGDRINLLALGLGVLAGLTVLVCAMGVPLLVPVTAATQNDLSFTMLVSAVYCVAKSMNSTIIGGLFPAGGDTRFGFWMDTIVMWGVVLPVAFVSAFVLAVPALFVYLILSSDEFLKLPFALLRYRQYRWLHQIPSRRNPE